ncbi:hypothetical protein HDU83_002802 [Entophlyctis luteolus]|nr:hypothetical protein HDU83_002802 [Entophlyctis luteolus]
MYAVAFAVYHSMNAGTHHPAVADGRHDAGVSRPLPLHPLRVVRVNKALLHHVWGLVCGPIVAVYSRWIAHVLVKDVRIATAEYKRGLRLDVHCARDDGAGTEVETHSGQPVIVFVYGGAWSSGSKEIYAPLGHALALAGYVVVVPDYTLYPKGVVEDMLDDVADALVWTYANIARYGGSPENITVMGHSAGAHLCALVLAHSAHTAADDGDGEVLHAQPDPHTRMRRLKTALPRVRGAVLLSGVYDVRAHYGFESGYGVEEISAMRRAMGSRDEMFDARSPVFLLDCLGHHHDDASGFLSLPDVDDRLRKHMEAFLPEWWLIVHGSNDTTVPVRESKALHHALLRLGFDTAKLLIFPNLDHKAPVIELMSQESEYTHQFLSELANLTVARQIRKH